METLQNSLHKLLSMNSGDKIAVKTLKQSLAESLVPPAGSHKGTGVQRRKYGETATNPKDAPLWYTKLKQST